MRDVRVPTIVAAIAGVLLSEPVSANAAATQLTVRTYDTFGVSQAAMDGARRTAGSILTAAGIEIGWRDCHPIELLPRLSTCDDPVGPLEVVVRIIAAGPKTRSGSLGNSWVDLQEKKGSLATVHADRVESLASFARLEPGTLLGRTMAHEIGHLLLGSSVHAPRSLMRACWSSKELQRNVAADWAFSRQEGALARRQLEARAKPDEDKAVRSN